MLDVSLKIALYQSMLRIRRVEECLADKYQENQMRCPIHLCIGQEAIASGISAHLSVKDAVFSNHRSHGHYLAKGGDLNAMIAELYGKETGCCGGRGGSMHLIDVAAGFLGATPIVGGTVPIAVGHAWASKLKQENSITIVYFGDGCFEQGVIHESLNFAALHALPIIFVCENNNYSAYTSLKERQPDRPIFCLAEAHGIMSDEGDGNDVYKVYELAGSAVSNVRSGLGPQFLEFKTHRWREHCGPYFDDDLGYREEGELDYWLDRCPVKLAKSVLVKDGHLSDDQNQRLERDILSEIDKAYEFASKSKLPNLDTLASSVYAA